MNDFYHIIGYNTQGEVQSVESTDDSWQAVELCLALSEEFGFAEVCWYAFNGKRVTEGHYTDRD